MEFEDPHFRWSDIRAPDLAYFSREIATSAGPKVGLIAALL